MTDKYILCVKFTAKTINNEWVEGLLSESLGLSGHPEAGLYISNRSGCPWAYRVRPETVMVCVCGTGQKAIL